jgi:glycosyltransferase involved in cell wall biosynthesis
MREATLNAASHGAPSLVIVQFGDYGAAEKRLAGGGHEDYYAQRYTVEYVKDLVRSGFEVATICLGSDRPMERLPSGVSSMGIELYPRAGHARIHRLLESLSACHPTHVILAVPLAAAIWWAVRRDIKILPLLADSFTAKDLKSQFRHFMLAAALNHPHVPWVMNHGINAARDLVRIGVPQEKVLAFDWPVVVRPEDFAPKSAPGNGRSIRVLYVGQLVEQKGLQDCIAALRLLGPRHFLNVVGTGDQALFEGQARDLGVADRVRFLGAVPHHEVLSLMHEHDVVVVPSRHEYPEGLPMTIYEGLCSRTPVVVSDHPMFNNKIVHEKSGLMFRAGDPDGLARTIKRLVDDGELYERLSLEAETACHGFFSGPKWHEILDHWLGGSSEDDAWLGSKTLASS